MNFFEHQDEARRKTRWMVLMFVAAVFGVIAAVDIALGLGYLYLTYSRQQHYGPAGGSSLSNIPHTVLLWGAGIALVIIIGQTLLTMLKLREGGSAVAEAFGARLVDQDTHDPKERQLLNVVEEMAIASGVRVPAVYILDDENGLNAFAAGHTVSDSIVAVTHGLLDALDRDELQGVIGHEFSHILNGDMSLNIRLIGVLAGIVAIGSIGFFLMRISSNRNSRNGMPLLLFGLALVVIGYTGLFFARLIKAAVSREREFLADASSVQFTRNPDGIAGALEKLRTAPAGALIQNRYAEEASHMFFGQSFRPWFSGLFATHPPLEERIERISPGFSLANKVRERIAARAADTRHKTPPQAQPQNSTSPLPGMNIPGIPAGLPGGVLGGAVIAGLAAGETGRADGAKMAVKAQPGQMADMAGATGKVETVQRQLAALPDGLRERVHQAGDACAIVLALMLAAKDEVRTAQLAAASAARMKTLAEAAAALEPQTRQVDSAMRFPLIDLALPAIKRAAPELKDGFLKMLEAVIKADRRLSPHEFVVLILMRFQVGDIPLTHAVKFRSLEEVQADVLWLLTLVAHAGCSATSEAERQKEFKTAFAAGAQQMKLENAAPAAHNTLNPQAAVAALGNLRQLAPLKKSLLIQGLFACVMADNEIRVIEAELMRMVGAVLDCPLPPMLEPDEITAV